jgi:hypothetical protein
VWAVLCLVVLSWAWTSEGLRLSGRLSSLWELAGNAPGRALALVALAGVLVANYPVVFAGRSFVSPNIGVPLLYGQGPWLPKNMSGEVGDAHNADVDALMWQHLPMAIVERQAVLRDGEVPLWNRYDSAGVPLLGQGQSCFGDPLQLIPLLAKNAAWAWDIKFLLAKWIFACAVGACVWRLFGHLPTSMLTALSACFLGFYIYRINHPAIFSLCYSPLILYAWLRCLDAKCARSAVIWLTALMGANWMELNSGTVKEAYVLLFSLNFSGLCMLLFSGRTFRQRAALLGGLCAAGVAFALISSPVWYTFYRALGASYTSYNSTEAFQIQPGMLIGLFDEAFYRPFQLQSGVINPSANFFILVGLLWVLVRWRSFLDDRRAVALLVSALPALALVFGVIPPGLIGRVPFLGNIMHVDNTFSCVLIVVLTVLSGLGWREAWGRLALAEGRREAVLVVAAVLVLWCAYLGTAQSVLRSAFASHSWGRNITLAPFIHGYGWSLVIAAALFLWALGRMRRQGTATPAMLICACVALGAFHWREMCQVGGGFDDYIVRPGIRAGLFEDSRTIDALRSHPDEPSRTVGFHNDLLPGWSTAYGVEGISGPDALVNPYYRELLDTAGINRVWDWRYIVEPPEVSKLKPVLDLLNIRYYVGYRLGDSRPGTELDPVLSADMDVYESKSAWPRAFFTDSAAVYNDVSQYCSWVRTGDGRPFAGIQLGDWVRLSPVPNVSGDLATRKVVPAENYRLTSNATSFTVAATGPGFIVLTEAFEKGNFRATVNGLPVPYLRINHAFKGVYVDAKGTYEVRFEYWPAGFSDTLILSGIGLGITAIALLAAVFSPGERRGAPQPA